jgi:hypothetical protein
MFGFELNESGLSNTEDQIRAVPRREYIWKI